MPCVDGQAKIGEPVEVDGWLIEIVNFAHESPGHGTETFNGERYAAVLFTRPWSGSSSIEKTHPPAHLYAISRSQDLGGSMVRRARPTQWMAR